MWISLLFVGIGVLVVVTLCIAGGYRLYVWYARQRGRDRLFAAVDSPPRRRIPKSEIDALPPPVQRYFRHVLSGGTRDIQTVWMAQKGSFRDADPTSPWNPFEATQAVRTQPVGFIWDASIQILPWMPVHVVDRYDENGGRLCARFAGVFPVMEGSPGPDMDEGELLRYLAETPLYPTALLPGRGVTWTSIDNQSARATLVDGDTVASLVFSFSAHDEITRVTGHRPFLNKEGTAERCLWTGTWSEYVDRGDVRIPTRGEVAWVHPDEGEVSYWRGRILSIAYNCDLSSGPSPESVPLSSVSTYDLGLFPSS